MTSLFHDLNGFSNVGGIYLGTSEHALQEFERRHTVAVISRSVESTSMRTKKNPVATTEKIRTIKIDLKKIKIELQANLY